MQYIATRTILDLCERYVRRPGAWVLHRWWDQEGIVLEGGMERLEAASYREEDKC